MVDCSQSPIFSSDPRDIARLTVNGCHLHFQMYRGCGRRGLLTLMQDGSPQRKAFDLKDLTEK